MAPIKLRIPDRGAAMNSDILDDNLREEIRRRDEFTCGLCGKMVPWEELMVVHRRHLRG